MTFDSTFFKANRDRLADACGEGLIFVAANGQLQLVADQAFPFRQDSTFWYLTGIDVADAVLVLDAGTKHAAIIMPSRDAHRDQWEGAIDTTGLMAASGVDSIYESRQGWAFVRSAAAQGAVLHTLMPPSKLLHKFYGIHPNPARAVLLKKLKALRTGTEIQDIRPHIKDLRIIKQPVELAAIKQAISVTEQALREVAEQRSALHTEYEAEAVLDAAIRRQGAPGQGYDPIVAGGVNAATLHYHANNQPIAPEDMLLIDAGARTGYYNADITRMFAPTKGMSARQQAVVDAVLEVQAFAYTLIKPGVHQREYETTVAEAMGRQLVDLGIIAENTPEEVRTYFPSLTSHHLGLDVHDISDKDDVFAPGMVITVEPGIYVAEEGIGVRIEDDIVITTEGYEILSDGLPPLL